ncbi:GC-rich sequence DNA-binding factor 2 isoform X1 [Cricetulus griseus]|uniref:GC-rich sequence DNA-binding factor 2 isoform X1 n=1 Tax=Cricetulus griseus TaxID=10029 RepID=A0A9J7GFZ5_CRIGR|nr:GC-rich sequence DNA-binding factor 2 isoform X1 [Cricetulus griseus]XP_027285245.1 GC-rich sequence DNA-binding factor 2 isoform X1 [Cricetulus griseus]
MALRPQRTFRRRQVESSDSDGDGAEERPAEVPADAGRPSAGGRAEGAEPPRRARGNRGRGRVWASSRRSPGTASRRDRGAVIFLESGTVDLSTDEEEEAHPSSESKDDQSPASHSSSSLEEKEVSPIVKIPDAAFIQEARRKRELARTPGDYISLDVNHPSTTCDNKRSNEEDPESDPDDYEKRILFAPKPQTLRQRMAEETSFRNEEESEDSQEDENQDIWEQQQMRKAVKIREGQNIDLSPKSDSQTLKKFDTSISFPPVNLEIIKKQLNNRLTLLQDTHRSHQREYEKYIEDIKSSKTAIQNLENASDQTLNYKFYKGMKIYVENIIDCLNEKIVIIEELESSTYTLLFKQSEALLKRRQDELKCESSYLQQLSRKAETSVNGSLAPDEKDQRILEEIEARRMQRRQARALSGNCDHQEGTSSDDELAPAEMTNFQKRQGDILQDCKRVFEDVHDDFCNVQNILLKFQQWREKFPDSYYEAFVGFCLPKLLSPLIRVQLLDWNPLKLDSMALNQMPWFTSITEFMDGSSEDPREEDGSDKKMLSAVINKTVVPRLADFVEFIWDPMSTSQTRSLTVHCRLLFEQLASENEVSKSKQDLLKSVVGRIKKSIEDDVFIPLYPKSSEEGKMSPHSKFQERQFWGALKLFRNILLWNGLLSDDTLQDLGLGKLLNRYLIIALTNAIPGPDAVKKCSQIAACLPEKWFENSAMRTSIPQLENFIQFLLQSAHKLSTGEFRNEVNEIILILVKVKALNQAESLREEHHLEPPISPISGV